MLSEIRSSVFRTEYIAFHPSLNVVLGDENATNSIGKSTLLMVVDFAFGGRALLDHNSDLVSELGQHDYFFSFDFEGEVLRFRRGTQEPDVVYVCDESYNPERAIPVDEYTALLMGAYGVTLPDLSFRALVGLYLRVWGKENLEVTRPLHAAHAQPARECVNTLLKLFDRYTSIRALAAELAVLDGESKALTAAKVHNIVPSIGKRDYAKNQANITELRQDLDDIKSNLARYATNLSAVVNKEILSLKIAKDDLLALRLSLASRQQRLQRNLDGSRHIRSKHFADLVRFFPEINQERLAQVEEFHSGVARLLHTELRDSERALAEQIGQIDEAVGGIDAQMTEALGSVKEPTVLVDRVFKLAVKLNGATEENSRYDSEQALRASIKELKSRLSDTKEAELKFVTDLLNDGLRRTVTAVFGPDRKSPRIELRESNYSYQVFEDTGTGTAYSSLIMLDLTVFLATQLPVIAHDSLLFKNIENDSVARLLQVYLQSQKQSFIALDEIEKYGADTATLLHSHSVIQLDDANVLYVRDWRT